MGKQKSIGGLDELAKLYGIKPSNDGRNRASGGNGGPFRKQHENYSGERRNNNNRNNNYNAGRPNNQSRSNRNYNQNAPRNNDNRPATAPYNFIGLPEKCLPSPLDEYRTEFSGGDQKKIRQAFRAYLENHPHYDGSIELNIETLTPFFIGGNGVQSYAPTGEPIIPGSTVRGMMKNLFKILTLGAMRPGEDFHERHLYYRCIMTTRNGEPWENDLHALYSAQMTEGTTRKTKPGFLIKTKKGYAICPMLKNPERVLIREYEKEFKEHIDRNMRDVRVDWKGGVAYAISGCKSDRGRGPALFETKRDYDNYMDRANRTDKMFIGKQFVLKYPLASADWSQGHRIEIGDDVAQEYRDDKNRRGVNLLAFRQDKKGDRGGAINGKKLRELVPNAPKDIELIAPCYYLPDDQTGQVRSFGHGRHFRIAYDRSIGDAVPAALKNPVIDFADAVFGANMDGKPLWASRVFFEDAHLDGELKKDDKPRRSHPLVGPNPTSFQLYLKQTPGKPLVNWGDEKATLRGYKLYWHRGNIPWTASPAEEQMDAGKTADKQMTREMTPLHAGNHFVARIRFRDLTSVELGALLSVLHPNGEDSLCCKLGHGKSLGLGSVRITSRLFVENKEAYSRLFDDQGWNPADREADSATYIADFRGHVEKEKMVEAQKKVTEELCAMLRWENTSLPHWKEQTRPMQGDVSNDSVDIRYKKRAILPNVAAVIKASS